MSSETIYSIYLITNKVNDKHYVGYTSNKHGHRFKDHCSTRTPKYQSRSLISLAIEKYGKDNFECTVIYQSKDYEHCRFIETDFITEYNSLSSSLGGHGYNIDAGGRGHKRSQETIEKHRAKLAGRPQSEEHKKKKGFKQGNDYGKRTKGMKRSEEHRKSSSESMKKRIQEGLAKPPTFSRTSVKNFEESISKQKRTKYEHRYKINKFKNIVVQYETDEPKNLDVNYNDFFKEQKLNNFMAKCAKDMTIRIKGWRLVSYELNA